MIVSNILLSPIRTLGRNGTWAVAVSAALGLCLPTLSAVIKPYLREAIIILLVLSFLRVDPKALKLASKQPWLLGLGAIWTVILLPLLGFALISFAGIAEKYPGLETILILMLVAPPVMSSVGFAYLLGLNGAISMAILILTMLMIPVTAPLISGILTPGLLHLSAYALAGQLVLLLVGCWAAAWIIRKLLGQEKLNETKSEIDGLNVIIMFLFAVGLMDGIPAQFTAAPNLLIGMTVASFIVALVQIGLTLLVFAPAGIQNSLPLALSVGSRNMGLMVAAIGTTMPELSWTWFAVAQFPIYLLPLMLTPLVRYLDK